jgi:hypothetical protein
MLRDRWSVVAGCGRAAAVDAYPAVGNPNADALRGKINDRVGDDPTADEKDKKETNEKGVVSIVHVRVLLTNPPRTVVQNGCPA